jgi:hypothetical protein
MRSLRRALLDWTYAPREDTAETTCMKRYDRWIDTAELKSLLRRKHIRLHPDPLW